MSRCSAAFLFIYFVLSVSLGELAARVSGPWRRRGTSGWVFIQKSCRFKIGIIGGKMKKLAPEQVSVHHCLLCGTESVPHMLEPCPQIPKLSRPQPPSINIRFWRTNPPKTANQQTIAVFFFFSETASFRVFLNVIFPFSLCYPTFLTRRPSYTALL